MSDSKLEKVTIHSFSDRNLDAKSEDTDRMFVVPINPETYTQNFKIELETSQGHGNQGTDPKFKSTAPEELRLEFILDGTGVMEGYHISAQGKSVKEQLENFKKCVYDMKEKIHRPRFLRIFWGKELNFPCVLSNLDINYTLFNTDGSPLRVKINATFLNYLAQIARIAAERTNSPDLTHYRLSKQSDRLDLLTYEIYNDSNYFLQVAKANGLSTVRRLKPGSEIYFPPFDKNEA